MKTSKLLLVVSLLCFCTIMWSQNNKEIINGTSEFVLRFNFVEMYKNGDKYSTESSTNTFVKFKPGIKTNRGELTITIDGEAIVYKIDKIRKVEKDGETFYMANQVNSIEQFFVWSYSMFLYCNNTESIQFTNSSYKRY